MCNVTMDKQYTYRNGSPARILCVDAVKRDGSLGVLSLDQRGNVWRHQLDGKICSINVESPYDLIEVSPYAHIKIDDKVWMWNEGDCKHKRHFAGVSDNGFPMAWNDGTTSWSTTDKFKSSWDHCEKVEE